MTEPTMRRVSTRTLALVTILLGSVGLAAGYFGLVYLNRASCPSGTTMHSFLIVSNYDGFNDSRDHPLTLNAQRNDCVLVTVENKDGQAHGLAVKTYFPSGIVVRPGETKSIRFYATSSGEFSISEPVFSTIYIFDRGVLSVTSTI